MAAQLALANQCVCDDNPAAALIAFERSIQEAPTAAAYAGRAALHIRERRFTDALQDAAAALKLDPNHEPSLYRKGVACFELDEFEKEQRRQGRRQDQEWVAAEKWEQIQEGHRM